MRKIVAAVCDQRYMVFAVFQHAFTLCDCARNVYLQYANMHYVCNMPLCIKMLREKPSSLERDEWENHSQPAKDPRWDTLHQISILYMHIGLAVSKNHV